MSARTSQSAATAIARLSPGSRVYASPYCGTPTTLLTALADQADRTEGLALVSGMLLGDLAVYDAVERGTLAMRPWHVSGRGRDLASAGRIDYVPLRAGEIERTVFAGPIDTAFVRVSPPDASGHCSLGPSASYSRAMIAAARTVIAEIDPDLPITTGDAVTIDVADLDQLVDIEHPTATIGSEPATPAATRIARQVATLVPPGAVLQLGIGAIPAAVAAELEASDLSGLRAVGLLTDAMLGLLASSRMDPAATVTAVELLGTEALFAAADRNRRIELAASSLVHDPLWLAGQSPLISICSALQVDLSGQVASEQVGGRVLAGVGGSVDFFEGARLGSNSLRIIALPATTRRGESCIRPALAADAPVTLGRHSVDVVVTEHGMARLRGASTRERAERLIAIAAPEHRAELDAARPV